jgi:excisionase family DNA binding protein
MSGCTTALPIEPLSVRVSVAVQLTGISRSRIYELIQSGDLEMVKVGRSTFIIFESLKRLLMR